MRDQRVARIMDVVRSRFADYQFTVDQLALEVGVSISYLREIVHIYYRMCPQQLIETVRLEEALRLLYASHTENLYTLCGSVGYLSVRTFLGAFKRRVGATPTEWKRSISEDKKGEQAMRKTVEHLWMRNSSGENFR